MALNLKITMLQTFINSSLSFSSISILIVKSESMAEVAHSLTARVFF